MKKAWQNWLSQRSPREQTGLVWAAVWLLVWLLWSWALAPAWQVVSGSQAQRERLAQQRSEMQALQQQALALRHAPRVSAEQAALGLQRLAQAAGPSVKFVRQGQQGVMDFKDLPPNTLADLLIQSRNQAHTQVQSAHWQRRDSGWAGQLVFTLPASP
ncbi:MAG: hypothetical protein EBZ60_05005 [Betaproteobacteria bacterium]|nr:hypothetical protein [Betaproteobacteria bacterium]